MIFLDTNVVSELLRPRPAAVVLAWSHGVPREDTCVACVVEAELRAGIERLPDGRRKREAGRDLDLYLAPTLGGRVLPLDRGAARFYGEFVAARGRAGPAAPPARPTRSSPPRPARTARRCSPRATRGTSRAAGRRW